VDADVEALEDRVATPKTVLMCRPEHFTVSYRINPWMEPANPTDTGVALRQWQTLYDTYQRLGFHVELIDPIAGLPDMVYAANGGFVLDGIAYGARFHFAERGPEGPAYSEWFAARGLRVVQPVSVNEGEGDFLKVGETIFAGTGFRSDAGSHAELRRIYDREVVTLRLVDPNSTTSTPPSPSSTTRADRPPSRTFLAPSTTPVWRSSSTASRTRSSRPTVTRPCSGSTRSATAATS